MELRAPQFPNQFSPPSPQRHNAPTELFAPSRLCVMQWQWQWQWQWQLQL